MAIKATCLYIFKKDKVQGGVCGTDIYTDDIYCKTHEKLNDLTQARLCCYIMKRGANKGEACGSDAVTNMLYCSQHGKYEDRDFNKIVVKNILKEVNISYDLKSLLVKGDKKLITKDQFITHLIPKRSTVGVARTELWIMTNPELKDLLQKTYPDVLISKYTKKDKLIGALINDPRHLELKKGASIPEPPKLDVTMIKLKDIKIDIPSDLCICINRYPSDTKLCGFIFFGQSPFCRNHITSIDTQRSCPYMDDNLEYCKQNVNKSSIYCDAHQKFHSQHFERSSEGVVMKHDILDKLLTKLYKDFLYPPKEDIKVEQQTVVSNIDLTQKDVKIDNCKQNTDPKNVKASNLDVSTTVKLKDNSDLKDYKTPNNVINQSKCIPSCPHINEIYKGKYCMECGTLAKIYSPTKESMIEIAKEIIILSTSKLYPPDNLIQFPEIRDEQLRGGEAPYFRLNTGNTVKASSIKNGLYDETLRISHENIHPIVFKLIVGMYSIIDQIYKLTKTPDTRNNFEKNIDILYNNNGSKDTKRKPISEALKTTIFTKSQGKCFCCDTKITDKHFEAGHIVPHKFGGDSTENNLVACCHACNDDMGTADLYEWMIRTDKMSPQFSNIIKNNEKIKKIKILKIISVSAMNKIPSLDISDTHKNKVKEILTGYKKYPVEVRDKLANDIIIM